MKCTWERYCNILRNFVDYLDPRGGNLLTESVCFICHIEIFQITAPPDHTLFIPLKKPSMSSKGALRLFHNV
jgi:hypothetical protein